MTKAPTTRETADHAELALLAEAATPGPWFASDWDADHGENLWTIEAREPEVLFPGQSSIWTGGVRCKQIARTEEGHNPTLDAAFIAAANPATVLALLSEIAALRVQVETEKRLSVDNWNVATDRATQAERQRDEALDAARKLSAAISWTDYPFIDNNTSLEEMISRLGFMQKDAEQPRAFLVNQGADPAPVKKERAWICPQDNTPCPPECDSDDRRHCASVACKDQPA